MAAISKASTARQVAAEKCTAEQQRLKAEAAGRRAAAAERLETGFSPIAESRPATPRRSRYLQ